MQKSFFKNIVALLLLVVVLIPTITNLHALEHISDDDNSNPCEQCEFINNSNELDVTIYDSSFDVKEPIYYPTNDFKSLNYNSPIEKIAKPAFVFNKPPPFI